MRSASARCSLRRLVWHRLQRRKIEAGTKCVAGPGQTPAHGSLLAAASSIAAISSVCISGVIALRRSGRFSVIVRTDASPRPGSSCSLNCSSSPWHVQYFAVCEPRFASGNAGSASSRQFRAGRIKSSSGQLRKRRAALRQLCKQSFRGHVSDQRILCERASAQPADGRIEAPAPRTYAARMRAAASCRLAWRCTPNSNASESPRAPLHDCIRDLVRRGEPHCISKRNLTHAAVAISVAGAPSRLRCSMHRHRDFRRPWRCRRRRPIPRQRERLIGFQGVQRFFEAFDAGCAEEIRPRWNREIRASAPRRFEWPAPRLSRSPRCR